MSVSIPSHLGSSFGLVLRMSMVSSCSVSIPSHLGSSFGRSSNNSNRRSTNVSIPSHLGSSFGHGMTIAIEAMLESQYPLIWAVASDGVLADRYTGHRGVSIPSHLGSSFGHGNVYPDNQGNV